MQKDRMNTKETSFANIARHAMMAESMNIHGTYHMECLDADGNLKWEDDVLNVITLAGVNYMLDNFITGSGFTQVGPYMGLISSVSWAPLSTTLASLTSYTSGTGIVSLGTTAAHGLGVGDSFTINSPTGTGTNYLSLAGTFTATAGTTGSTLNFFVGTGLTITTVTGGALTTNSASRKADTMGSHGLWLEAGSTNAPTFAARIAPAWSASSAGVKSTSSAVSFTMTAGGTLEGCFIVLGTSAVATLMSTAGTLFSAGAFSAGAKLVSATDVVNVSYSVGV